MKGRQAGSLRKNEQDNYTQKRTDEQMIYDHITDTFILERKDLADAQRNETEASIRNAKKLEYALNSIGAYFEARGEM